MGIVGKLLNKVAALVGKEVRIVPKHQSKTLDVSLYKKHYSIESITGRRFYNIGAGSFYHPLWTNLDYVSDWYKDVQSHIKHIDLMKLGPLPIETNSAEVLYTEHTIEHVKDEAVRNLTKEAYRCLKPGGYFRVTTGPDADTDWDALNRGDEDWFYWNKWYEQPGSYEHIYYHPANSVPLEERWLHHVASQLAPNDISPSKVKLNAVDIKRLMRETGKEQLLDYLTNLCEFQPERPGNHVSWWNADKIIRYLKAAGFTNVYRSAYEQSHCPILRDENYFDRMHPQITVYVEAIK